MTRIIAGLLAVVLIAGSGCADKKSVPSDILSREKMEAVLWDVIQAEQYSSGFLAKDSARIDLKLENLRLYDQVFRLHQISRDEFRKSYQFYMDRPDLTQVLFDSLLSRGNRLRTESYSRPTPKSTVTSPVGPAKSPAATPALVMPPAPSLKLRDSVRRLHGLPLRSSKRLDSAAGRLK